MIAAFVVRACGYYADETVVVSSHRTVRAAHRAAGPGWTVRLGSLAKGDTFRRSAEAVYPEAK